MLIMDGHRGALRRAGRRCCPSANDETPRTAFAQIAMLCCCREGLALRVEHTISALKRLDTRLATTALRRLPVLDRRVVASEAFPSWCSIVVGVDIRRFGIVDGGVGDAANTGGRVATILS